MYIQNEVQTRHKHKLRHLAGCPFAFTQISTLLFILSMTIYYPRLQIATQKELLPVNQCYPAYMCTSIREVNTAWAGLCVLAHTSRCTCLCTYLKPSFLSRKMLVTWMLEQTVFTPFQMRPQVIGPYAVFFRNLICCQSTSTHMDDYFRCLSIRLSR